MRNPGRTSRPTPRPPGTITEEHRRNAAARTEEYVHAYRLAEIRRTRRLTQVQLAETMHVTQPRISGIEHGTLDAVQLSTLRNYVHALGAHLTITARVRLRTHHPGHQLRPSR
ncbi:MAG: transcriptional regulator [Pseudonocardiales bacterium]|nr:MAG: transcriptional regulator [Pseudonocardiales bacterium]